MHKYAYAYVYLCTNVSPPVAILALQYSLMADKYTTLCKLDLFFKFLSELTTRIFTMMVLSVLFQSLIIVRGQLVTSLCNTHFSCFISAWEFFYDYAFLFYLYPDWPFSLTTRIQAKTSNSQLSTFSRWFIFCLFFHCPFMCMFYFVAVFPFG